MLRFSQADIQTELLALGNDLAHRLRQELAYYRASVYKDESAGRIRDQIKNLRLLSALIADETLIDAFRDHDEMLAMVAQLATPGECSFSQRTSQLLNAVCQRLIVLEEILAESKDVLDSASISDKIIYKRRELLAMCREGSRQWSFFQTL